MASTDQEKVETFRKWLQERLYVRAKQDVLRSQREPSSKIEVEEVRERFKGIWDRCQILTYKPYTCEETNRSPQQLFHDSRAAQVRGLIAPNQRGKTHAGIAEVIAWGLGFEPWSGRVIPKIGKTPWRPRMRFFVASSDFSIGLNEVILPKINELLPLDEIGCRFMKLSGITHKIVFPDPYSFSLKFLSYEQDQHKAEGTTWNGGWFDEPPPKHLYTTCRRGCLRHAAPIIFTGTLINEPWVYDEIYAAEDTVNIDTEADLKKVKWNTKAVVKIRYEERPPGVTKEQIDAWAATLDEEEKEARIYGNPIHLEGRVYKEFDRHRQVTDRDRFLSETHGNWRDYPGFCVIDPHDRKPFAIMWGIVTPREQKVFIREWPPFDFTRQKTWKWSIDEYADEIRRIEREMWGDVAERAVMWRVMDPNFGRTQKAGGGITVEEMFAQNGLFFDTNVDDNVEAGHLAVKAAIHHDELVWLTGMPNAVKSMENYTWDDYRGRGDRSPKEKAKDKYKDFADLVRYTVMSDFRFVPHHGITNQKNPWIGAALG